MGARRRRGGLAGDWSGCHRLSPTRYLPGLAWTCWDLPGGEVTLLVRCQEIGNCMSIFTQRCSVWVGVALGMERGPTSAPDGGAPAAHPHVVGGVCLVMCCRRCGGAGGAEFGQKYFLQEAEHPICGDD